MLICISYTLRMPRSMCETNHTSHARACTPEQKAYGRAMFRPEEGFSSSYTMVCACVPISLSLYLSVPALFHLLLFWPVPSHRFHLFSSPIPISTSRFSLSAIPVSFPRPSLASPGCSCILHFHPGSVAVVRNVCLACIAACVDVCVLCVLCVCVCVRARRMRMRTLCVCVYVCAYILCITHMRGCVCESSRLYHTAR